MNDFCSIAEAAARTAGKYLLSKFRSTLRIEKKGVIDLVTDVDRESEKLIKEIITNEFPDHQFLAEEGEKAISDSEFLWLVDPLDGTTNYAHGFPVFCVSIALLENGHINTGCIFNPILDECFTAVKGKGARLNNKAIKVSGTPKLTDSLLATGFPYDIRESDDDNINEFAAFAKSARAVRRAGSAALDLAYVACGRFDGFWEFKLAPWDLAAGIIMVLEAGGKVSSYAGGNYDLFSGEALASNGLIHSQMLDVLNKIR
jgi:myo-inositol-1(or 4)-monophosphatase